MPPSSLSSPPARPFQRHLERLRARRFDLLVIGGGSIGAGVARDAALRGISVALLEAEDFGHGTVSRSTRLIHGGLRYLEQYDFRLVRESLREREVLLHLAPHLVRPLPFLTPLYRGDRWSPLLLAAGMVLYDLLSFDRSLPGHRLIGPQEALRLEPGLNPDRLLGATLYYDAQVASPERLCLALARSAAHAGAVCANHVRVTDLLREEGRVYGVEAEDALTGERFRVRARQTVNATGPWAGTLAPTVDGAPRLRRTKGVHLLVPAFTRHATLLLAPQDGRVFFTLPWEGRTMIGTTDTDFTGDPADATASAEDVRYLLDATRKVFPKANLHPVEAAFAGVRPLLPVEGGGESQVTREHRILDHAGEGLPGLTSVFGGKITTARAIAEEVTDLVAVHLGVRAPCRTAELSLPGGALGMTLDAFTERVRAACQAAGVEGRHAESLVAAYGADAMAALGRVRAPAAPESRPTGIDAVRVAKLEFGVEEEMAMTTPDLLLRRTLLGYHEGQARDIAPWVARWLGKRAGATDAAVRADLAEYERQAKRLAPP